MNLDFIPESTRAAGLGALMKGAGAVTRVLPIPQPTLLVGPGSSRRLGQAVAGFGHDKVLIVTDAMIVRLGLLQPLTAAPQPCNFFHYRCYLELQHVVEKIGRHRQLLLPFGRW